ncbi:MAG: hypothetical protein QME60_03925 [Verrucomicrobiota bacterium]|nr:hypothetical protein [Verrucomicrobiota bacterium]
MKIDGARADLTAKIEGVEKRLGAKIDGAEKRLGAGVDGIDKRLAGVEQAQADMAEKLDMAAKNLAEHRADAEVHRSQRQVSQG